MRTLVVAHSSPSRPLHPAPPAVLRARTGLGKRLLWLAATLLAFEVFYVVAGNLFLRFGLQPLVNMDPESMVMRYDSASTFFPGVAHVHNYRLTSQDRNIQWTIEVEDADLTVDLPALFSQTFRATRVRATGVAFRIRQKLDTAGAALPRAKAIPPIEGYEDPPLRPIGPDEAVPSEEDYSLWTVSIDDIDAMAREIWIDETRLVGPIRARGGFFLKPMKLVQIGPATVDITGGEIWIGDQAAAKPLDAHIESTVGAIDLQGPAEGAVRAISAHAQLAAETPGVAFARLYLGEAPTLRLDDGHGSLRADVYLEHGRLMPRTTLAMESPRLAIGKDKLAVTLDYRFESQVVAADPQPLATGDLFIGKATLVRTGAEGASPRIEKAHARFLGLPRDLLGPYVIEKTELDVPATVPDLRWLLPPRKAGEDRPVDLAGSSTVHARAVIDSAMHATGDVATSAGLFDLKTSSFQVRGKLSSQARFRGADLATGSLTLDPSFVLAEDVAVTKAQRTHAGGTLRVDLTKGRLDAGVPRDLALSVAAKVPDLRWLASQSPAGEGPSFGASAAAVNADLSIPRPALLFDGTPDEAAVTGSIRMSGAGNARFTKASLRGTLEVTARLQRLDLGRGIVHLRDLDVVTRDLSIEHGDTRTPGWWGRFAVPRLDVDTTSKDTLFLHADARCKDGAPFLAVLASEGSIPGWTGSIFPMNELTAAADVRLSGGQLDLGLQARASSANITARLHDIGPTMGGAVEIKTKLASLGFGFTKGESQLKVFAGEEWLNTRIAEINAKSEADRAAAPEPTSSP